MWLDYPIMVHLYVITQVLPRLGPSRKPFVYNNMAIRFQPVLQCCYSAGPTKALPDCDNLISLPSDIPFRQRQALDEIGREDPLA